MLKAESISKSYGGVKVLQGIDIQIGKGEIVSIVGASGAGKTTLLHILGTLDAPDLGRVVIKKVNVFELGKKDLATFRNKEIGFVFQSHSLFPEFTALENVCIPAFIRKKVGTKKKARRLLDQLGLSTRLNHKPSELSGGERQRVAVARALINKPSVVFADEPSGNLDSLHASELHDLFFDLRDEVGQTFVLVTHNTSLAKMADTTFKIKDGKIYHQR